MQVGEGGRGRAGAMVMIVMMMMQVEHDPGARRPSRTTWLARHCSESRSMHVPLDLVTLPHHDRVANPLDHGQHLGPSYHALNRP